VDRLLVDSPLVSPLKLLVDSVNLLLNLAEGCLALLLNRTATRSELLKITIREVFSVDSNSSKLVDCLVNSNLNSKEVSSELRPLLSQLKEEDSLDLPQLNQLNLLDSALDKPTTINQRAQLLVGSVSEELSNSRTSQLSEASVKPPPLQTNHLNLSRLEVNNSSNSHLLQGPLELQLAARLASLSALLLRTLQSLEVSSEPPLKLQRLQLLRLLADSELNRTMLPSLADSALVASVLPLLVLTLLKPLLQLLPAVYSETPSLLPLLSLEEDCSVTTTLQLLRQEASLSASQLSSTNSQFSSTNSQWQVDSEEVSSAARIRTSQQQGDSSDLLRLNSLSNQPPLASEEEDCSEVLLLPNLEDSPSVLQPTIKLNSKEVDCLDQTSLPEALLSLEPISQLLKELRAEDSALDLLPTPAVISLDNLKTTTNSLKINSVNRRTTSNPRINSVNLKINLNSNFNNQD